MRRPRLVAGVVAFLLACAVATSARGITISVRIHVGVPGTRTITYVGVARDVVDLRAIGSGRAGFWFPQFGAPTPVAERPTGERARSWMPAWIAPFNHTTGPSDPGCSAPEIAAGCMPGYLFRTFSQDGPARTSGGRAGWSALVLPDGTSGASGAVVDPFTRGNSNNTVNRIQLRTGVPSSFLLGVLTDNTNREHDPAASIAARGNVGPLDANAQIEADTLPGPADLVFNGVPDVYTFRFEGFVAGDYLKLRLNGGPAPGGASFGGLLFDDV